MASMAERVIGRMITRLRDKTRLTSQEEDRLEQMLDKADKELFLYLHHEIRQGNDLMLLPTDKAAEVSWRVNQDEEWEVAMWSRHCRYQEKRLKALEPQLNEAKKRALGKRNPNYQSAVKAIEAEIEDWEERRKMYVATLEKLFRKMSTDSLANYEPLKPGPWNSLDDLPARVEHIDNIAWPNHPNAERQAYIETLQAKLDRIQSAQQR